MNTIRICLFFCFFMFLMTMTAQANRFFTWFCERYHDTAYDADGFFHGYEDYYTTPYGYFLPINRYFNYCPPCPYYFNCRPTVVRMPCGPYCDGGCTRRRR